MEGELSFNKSRRQVQIQYRDSKPGLWLFVVPKELTRVSEARPLRQIPEYNFIRAVFGRSDHKRLNESVGVPNYR